MTINKVFFRSDLQNNDDNWWFGEDRLQVGQFVGKDKLGNELFVTKISKDNIDYGNNEFLEIFVTGDKKYCDIPMHMICRLYYDI